MKPTPIILALLLLLGAAPSDRQYNIGYKDGWQASWIDWVVINSYYRRIKENPSANKELIWADEQRRAKEYQANWDKLSAEQKLLIPTVPYWTRAGGVPKEMK